MGSVAACRARIDGRQGACTALLEGEVVVVRGELRAKVSTGPGLAVTVDGPWLRLARDGALVELELGPAAARWAEKLRAPKSVVDKLGVKADERVAFVGEHEAWLVDACRSKGARVTRRAPSREVDTVFFRAARASQLTALARLRAQLSSAGAVWVVREKGSALISEGDVRAAAKAAGLVDVKVVKVSDALTAEKLVIPRSAR